MRFIRSNARAWPVVQKWTLRKNKRWIRERLETVRQLQPGASVKKEKGRETPALQ